MESKDTFKMTYSAGQQEEIEEIRKKYVPKETSKMDQLHALDESAEKKATRVSILIGIIGTLIMGVGMSLTMTEIGNVLGTAAMPVGIVIGVLGIAILALAYPIYNRTLQKEREKIAPEILRLSDELLK